MFSADEESIKYDETVNLTQNEMFPIDEEISQR